MADKIYVNDSGIAFRASIKDADDNSLDLTSADTVKMWFQKPSLTEGGSPEVVEMDATVMSPASAGVVQYVTVNGDLDRSGSWKAQAYVRIGASRVHSDIQAFKVLANLKADPE